VKGKEDEVTFIPFEKDWDMGEGVYSCDNCGATAQKVEEIQHHRTCTPGESKKWEKYYQENGEHFVHPFEYNGFYGNVDTSKYVDYTASFLEWTSDPGIARCECSDGEERLIPTFAMKGFNVKDYPEQPKTGVMFGPACQS